MVYEAVIIGNDFAKACKRGSIGRIHSVFERAVNIEIKNSSQQLLTLIDEEVDIMSANLVVRSTRSDWRNYIAENEPVIFTSESVFINNRLLVMGISTSKTWMRISDYEIVNMSQLVDSAKVLEHCKMVEGYLFSKTITSIDFPVSNISDLNPLALIGLGYGLTPSGDDFLSGVLHGLHFAEILFRAKFPPLSGFSQVISDHLSRTGSISQHFLKYALKGQWGFNTENFLLALINGDEKTLLASVDKKLSIGASSGYDEMMGCLYGIRQYIAHFQTHCE